MTRLELMLLRWEHLLRYTLIAVMLLVVCGVVAGMWHSWGLSALWFFASGITAALLQQWVRTVREHYIREMPLPRFLQRKLRATYPHLSSRDCDLVERGLRQFFLVCLRSRRQFVAMPSQAVDVLWHEFILHTQAYKHWCALALGHFLHHTPAEALGRKASRNDGLRRAWYWACKEESIDPKAPLRLPLLFALDAKFAIPGGFHYTPDCRLTGSRAAQASDGGGSPHCGTDFSDHSYSGSCSDFGGADDSSASGGGGGGDGGGDGGGCGGGGD